MITEKHYSILNYISSKTENKDEVTHAWRVAENTKEYSSNDRIYIVALLHDVVEILQKWYLVRTTMSLPIIPTKI